MPSSTNPDTPPPSGPHTSGRHETDPRPHLAALLELRWLGWHVTAIRPDVAAPVLWRVTITRYDGNASITVADVDPDDAIDELVHYASADAESPRATASRRAAVSRPAATPAGGPG